MRAVTGCCNPVCEALYFISQIATLEDNKGGFKFKERGLSYYENARVQVVCCGAHRDHAQRDGCDSGSCLSEYGRTLDTERGKMVLFGRAGEYSVRLDLRQQQLVLFLATLGGLAQRLAGASGRKTVLLQHEA